MDKVIGFLIAAIVAATALGIFSSMREVREWEEFSARHECKIVGKQRGEIHTTVAPIIGGNGGMAVGTTVTPDRTGWLCNDGVTYWR